MILTRCDGRERQTPLVKSDFMTPRGREILAESGAGYADANEISGLVLRSLPCYRARQRNAIPEPDERPLRSLKGARGRDRNSASN